MERNEWLRQVRGKTESLYDHISPKYWQKYGIWVSETHVRFLLKFLRRLPAHGNLLSAGCGAGLYDGMMQDEGHTVTGIDLSAEMLNRAHQRHLPMVWIHAGNRIIGTGIPTSLGRRQGRISYENFLLIGRKI